MQLYVEAAGWQYCWSEWSTKVVRLRALTNKVKKQIVVGMANVVATDVGTSN